MLAAHTIKIRKRSLSERRNVPRLRNQGDIGRPARVALATEPEPQIAITLRSNLQKDVDRPGSQEARLAV